jgi:thymidylate kinase
MFKASNGRECTLIAIEGADRVGKATQAKMLEDSLCRNKHKATVEEVPYDDGVTYNRIYEMLRDGSALKFPIVFQTLQGINRRYFQTRFLPTLAGHYDVVVLDRWTTSTRVYGAASGVPEETTDAILEEVVPADLTLVLDRSPLPKADLDSYESNTPFQQAVRQGYLSYCERWPQSFVKIDASGSRETVHDQVLREALRLLR